MNQSSSRDFDIDEYLGAASQSGTVGTFGLLGHGAAKTKPTEDDNWHLHSSWPTRKWNVRTRDCVDLGPENYIGISPSPLQPLSLLRMCTDSWADLDIDVNRATSSHGLGIRMPLMYVLASGALVGCSVGLHQQVVPWAQAEAVEWNSPAPKAAEEATVAKQIIDELSQLKDGWDGEDAVRPSEQLISDIDETFAYMAIDSGARPNVEVDEDGTVAMFWNFEPRQMFSMNFGGNGKVVMSYVTQTPGHSFARAIEVSDKGAIFRALAKAKMSWAVSLRA